MKVSKCQVQKVQSISRTVCSWVSPQVVRAEQDLAEMQDTHTDHVEVNRGLLKHTKDKKQDISYHTSNAKSMKHNIANTVMILCTIYNICLKAGGK